MEKEQVLNPTITPLFAETAMFLGLYFYFLVIAVLPLQLSAWVVGTPARMEGLVTGPTTACVYKGTTHPTVNVSHSDWNIQHLAQNL